mgnify:CR=1 FL=1
MYMSIKIFYYFTIYFTFSIDKYTFIVYNNKRKEVIDMAKKKRPRRRTKPAARVERKPVKNNDFWKSVLSGTISGLIVLMADLLIEWLTKR